MESLIFNFTFNLIKKIKFSMCKIKEILLLCLITILIWNNFCQVVTWVLRISQKSFCIQNVPFDPIKIIYGLKTLIFSHFVLILLKITNLQNGSFFWITLYSNLIRLNLAAKPRLAKSCTTSLHSCCTQFF